MFHVVFVCFMFISCFSSHLRSVWRVLRSRWSCQSENWQLRWFLLLFEKI